MQCAMNMNSSMAEAYYCSSIAPISPWVAMYNSSTCRWRNFASVSALFHKILSYFMIRFEQIFVGG